MRFFGGRVAKAATLLITVMGSVPFAAADFDPANNESIKAYAKNIASDMILTWYHPETNGVGLLGKPYYWWEAGAMWGAMVDYSHYTGDHKWDEKTGYAIFAQIGTPGYPNLTIPSQRFDDGNDDQAFWALAAMSADEDRFTQWITPEPEVNNPWVYDQIANHTIVDFQARWDNSTCGGGLRWAIYPENIGWDYKSTIANAGFFQLAARWARNFSYRDVMAVAEQTYDWMTTIGLINSTTGEVYDGAGTDKNCTIVNKTQWSYNAGMVLEGCARVYDWTKDDKWRNRTIKHFHAARRTFFSPYSNATDIMYEPACELANSCNTDQLSFKAQLARALGKTARLLPELEPEITCLLRASAVAAVNTCRGAPGSESGTFCGGHWAWKGLGGPYQNWDGTMGVGQQLCALEVVQALMAEVQPPFNPKAWGECGGPCWPDQ